MVRILVGARGRRAFQTVERSVEHHAGQRHHAAAGLGGGEFRVDRLQSHLVVQRADDELADRDLAAVREERPHAQVRIDADDARRVDRAVGTRDELAVVDALAGQCGFDGRIGVACGRQRLRAQVAQVARDLVGEHFLQAEAEEVRRIAAVGARGDVAADARRAARPPVACGATVGHAGADREVGADVAAPVRRERALALHQREFALEELAAAPDGAERIARNDERGGLGRVPVAAIRADLLFERLGDPLACGVGCLDAVDELGLRSTGRAEQDRQDDGRHAGESRLVHVRSFATGTLCAASGRGAHEKSAPAVWKIRGPARGRRLRLGTHVPGRPCLQARAAGP